MHIVFSGSWNYFFLLHFNLDIFSSLYATDMYREYMPCIGNPAYSFRPILLKLYRYFAAFLWFHMRNLSLAGYNCSGGASCMACSFIKLLFLKNRQANYIWIIHGMGERKFVQMVQLTWPRWPPCPYMVTTLKNFPLWNQMADDLESWYTASGTRVLPSLFKWCPGLTLTYFTARSNLIQI